jgi:large subunit ribosomal protein L35
VTAKKKILRSKAFKRHILTKKSAKRKRGLGKRAQVSPTDRAAVKSMLPYEF